jgi:formate dehydrogenase accessory protein FdhE
VASSFFRRLLGARDPLPAELESAITELDELTRTRPALAEPGALLRAVLSHLHHEPVPAKAPALPDAVAIAKVSGGIPLLRGETLELDQAALQRRFALVCADLERHRADERLLTMASTLQAEELLTAVLAGQPDRVAAHADSLGVDGSLAGMALRLSCLPLLARLAADMESLYRPSAWDRGYCPVCGSWPLLGEFRGLDQTRVLRCAFCAAGWDFPRLRCPFCDSRDHRQLGYLHADGQQDRCRAATCDGCRGYVKMISTLDTLPLPGLLVADLATLHLDLAAAERGFLIPHGE